MGCWHKWLRISFKLCDILLSPSFSGTRKKIHSFVDVSIINYGSYKVEFRSYRNIVNNKIWRDFKGRKKKSINDKCENH